MTWTSDPMTAEEEADLDPDLEYCPCCNTTTYVGPEVDPQDRYCHCEDGDGAL